MVRRIKGVSVAALINGRGVEVIFKSPYKWRVYEGDKDVSRDFGFVPGQSIDDTDPRWRQWHDTVDASECDVRLSVA